MLEGIGLGCVQKAPIVPKDVAPRNDTKVDGCGDCFSAVEYSPKHRLNIPQVVGGGYIGFSLNQGQ